MIQFALTLLLLVFVIDDAVGAAVYPPSLDALLDALYLLLKIALDGLFVVKLGALDALDECFCVFGCVVVQLQQPLHLPLLVKVVVVALLLRVEHSQHCRVIGQLLQFALKVALLLGFLFHIVVLYSHLVQLEQPSRHLRCQLLSRLKLHFAQQQLVGVLLCDLAVWGWRPHHKPLGLGFAA